MMEMNYLKKSLPELVGGANHPGTYDKPAVCPHCKIGVDAPVSDYRILPYAEKTLLYIVSCRCTVCNRNFLFSFLKETQTNSENIFIYPPFYEEFKNEAIEKLSPRFVDVMNQSLKTEAGGAIDLAATGYRLALECLVKDYAIKECQADYEKVKNMKLINAIKEYLNQDTLVAVADVVRILGNDYAHYERKYPQYDLNLLKKYLHIFIKIVETNLLVAHPPVTR